LSYGSSYMGPIGAVISPLLWPEGGFADLPSASSLCGRCTEVCPVGIPLHRMLLDLRADAVVAGKAGSVKERAAWKAWAFTFGDALTARAASAAGRAGLRVAGRLSALKGAPRLPRVLPSVAHGNQAGSLRARPDFRPAPVVIAEPEVEPGGLPGLFRLRAAALGVTVADSMEPVDGERRLRATAAIASTGSVLLTGDAAARRPLLAASRVVIEVDPASIVRYPQDLAPYLGAGDALILTGASRTADIEKQIVRGIHGSEELVVVLGE